MVILDYNLTFVTVLDPTATPPQGKCYKRSCHHQWSGSQENATIIDGRSRTIMVVTIGYRMIHFGHNHFVAQFRSSSKLMMVFVEQCKIAKKSTLYVPCAASALAFVDRTIRHVRTLEQKRLKCSSI